MPPDADHLQREITELRERIVKLEQELSAQLPEDDEAEPPPDEITFAEVLKNPEVTKALNTAVGAWASTRPDEMKLRFRALHLGFVFSWFVLATVAVLGYLRVISTDVTGSLLGALIGYWYGRYQERRQSK